MEIKEQLPLIQENVSLAPLTTFKIGGPARYFYVAQSKGDLVKAVKAAKECQLPFFVLGGGSNLLVSDKGFEGLVIQTRNSAFEIQNGIVEAESGVPLATLVAESLKRGLRGLEWAVGIPGTIGGAVCGNASAYGHRTSEVVTEVEILDEKGEIRTLSNKDCQFGYHQSIFKGKPWVILKVGIRLGEGSREESQEIAQEHLKDRQRRIPPFPSVGSIFVGVVYAEQTEKAKKMIDPGVVVHGVVPVWRLIEKVGLAGKRAGGAEIPARHANIIINRDNAKAADVVTLINLCKQKVKEKFGIKLEEEIQYLGF